MSRETYDKVCQVNLDLRNERDEALARVELIRTSLSAAQARDVLPEGYTAVETGLYNNILKYLGGRPYCEVYQVLDVLLAEQD